MVRVYDPLYRLMGWNISGDFGPWTFYKSRRKKLVFYPAMPALEPPSPAQKIQQAKFRNAAKAWKQLSAEQRAAWERTTKRLSMTITGYGLWTWWQCKEEREPILTAQRQAGTHLID